MALFFIIFVRMKKLLILLAALLLLASCGPKTQFTVVGQFMPGSRGDNVCLMAYFTDTEIPAECVTKDRTFNLRGEIAEPRFVRVIQDDGFNDWAFVLEPGVIYLSPADHFAGGTPLNDALREFFDAIRNIYTERITDVDADARSREIVLDFIARHDNDIAGAYVLAGNYSVLSLEDMKRILSEAGPVFLSSEFVTFLRNKIRPLNNA